MSIPVGRNASLLVFVEIFFCFYFMCVFWMRGFFSWIQASTQDVLAPAWQLCFLEARFFRSHQKQGWPHPLLGSTVYSTVHSAAQNAVYSTVFSTEDRAVYSAVCCVLPHFQKFLKFYEFFCEAIQKFATGMDRRQRLDFKPQGQNASAKFRKILCFVLRKQFWSADHKKHKWSPTLVFYILTLWKGGRQQTLKTQTRNCHARDLGVSRLGPRGAQRSTAFNAWLVSCPYPYIRM